MKSEKEEHISTVAAFLENFFKHRTLLIQRLESGEITKRFYLEQCHDYFKDRGIKPFKAPIKTFEEGMMNYQYHNTYAKYYKMLIDESFMASYSEIRAFEKKMDEHYLLKDQATLALLEIVSYKNLEAYYLEMRSERLSGKLFEIVFTDRPLAILHSMDVRIQRKLERQGCFTEGKKKSLIDDYVNTKY